MRTQYTELDWIEEMKLNMTCNHSYLGSCIIPCPNCGIYGFYGPKSDKKDVVEIVKKEGELKFKNQVELFKHLEGSRHYAGCKYCGFWQDVGCEPYFCYPIYCHSCGGFGWTQNDKNKPCDRCDGEAKRIDIKSVMQSLEEIRKEIYMIHQYPKPNGSDTK